MVKGNVAKSQLQALFNNSANSSQWVKVDSTTTFDVNTTNANNLTVTALPSGGGPAPIVGRWARG